MAIDHYYSANSKKIIIKEMEDEYLLNAHSYFCRRREKLIKTNASSLDILRISLLISHLNNEINERRLMDF